MSTKLTFGLLFYINQIKQKKNGECPVMKRITINGQKLAFQLKRFIKPDKWDVSKHRMKGRSEGARVFNDYIEVEKLKAHKKYNELHTVYDGVTPQMLRDAILGVNIAKPKMLIEVWQEHLVKLKQLIGKGNSYATYQKYNVAKNHMIQFIKTNYRINNISIKQIDHVFISKFFDFLKLEKN